MAKKSTKRDFEKKPDGEKIVINAAKGLVFSTEEELFKHFELEISTLESFYFNHRSKDDISVDDFTEYEDCLSTILADPDEIWVDKNIVAGKEIFNFIAEFEEDGRKSKDKKKFHYIAQVYMSSEVPTFVYLHFPTNEDKLINLYRGGEKIYDRSDQDVPLGAQEGDALNEGEPLAVGLYEAMMKVRSDTDISEEDFPKFFEFRENTIEEPDEIWRSTDSRGNILVNFIKEFPPQEGEGENILYVAVTQEDAQTESHLLLFSFPSRDKSLVDRYRHGENMHADEVSQEPSH